MTAKISLNHPKMVLSSFFLAIGFFTSKLSSNAGKSMHKLAILLQAEPVTNISRIML